MYRKILIAGSGLVGSEIGFQCARAGLDVAMLDISDETLALSRERHRGFADAFVGDGRATAETMAATLARLTYHSDVAAAADDADLVSESVTESVEVKRETFEALSRACPAKTVFTTNTSLMLPSALARFTDRPEKFLACHVGRPVWESRILEIMPHAETDPALIDDLRAFARQIDLVPFVLKKEKGGYISNSIIEPYVAAAINLVRQGIAAPEEIDRLWMFGMQAPLGPIALTDLMGIPTVHTAMSHLIKAEGRSDLIPVVDFLKSELLDHGKHGAQNGQGFYTYPDPLFQRPDFLTGEMESPRAADGVA